MPLILDGNTVINDKIGKFVSCFSENSSEIFKIGEIDIDSFSASYRSCACWMDVKNGLSSDSIPNETQYLLLKKDEIFTMVFALAYGNARSSIYSKDRQLFVNIETYDQTTAINETYCVYVIDGVNPYRMIDVAYIEMKAKLNTFDLKKEEFRPNFSKMFGFCTYNAFGCDISESKITEMVADFQKNDIQVGFIIFDDGWQTQEDKMLSSLDENKEKFKDGLAHAISILKNDYSIKYFICWQAYNGYWCGVKTDNFSNFKVNQEFFNFPKRFLTNVSDSNKELNTVTGDFYPMNIVNNSCGVLADFKSFYFEFYKNLKEKGVNGIKIDAIAWIEAFSEGKGGRVKVMKDLVDAIDSASLKYFKGEHINCSSCSNDFFCSMQGFGITRLSSDYNPDDVSSLISHLYSNAYVGFWTQPIAFGDWDMFQSGNIVGKAHAKARSISGGPVYSSDNQNSVNFNIIKPLVSKNGYVAQCRNNAVPTLDCLFYDYKSCDKPLKLFNVLSCGFVLGAFSCGKQAINGTFKLSDVVDIPYAKYLVYSEKRGVIGVYIYSEDNDVDISFSLNAYDSEIFTISKIDNNGIAIIGLKDKYNPLGFVDTIKNSSLNYTINVIDDGSYLIYDEKQNSLKEYVSQNKQIEIKNNN